MPCLDLILFASVSQVRSDEWQAAPCGNYLLPMVCFDLVERLCRRIDASSYLNSPLSCQDFALSGAFFGTNSSILFY